MNQEAVCFCVVTSQADLAEDVITPPFLQSHAGDLTRVPPSQTPHRNDQTVASLLVTSGLASLKGNMVATLATTNLGVSPSAECDGDVNLEAARGRPDRI